MVHQTRFDVWPSISDFFNPKGKVIFCPLEGVAVGYQIRHFSVIYLWPSLIQNYQFFSSSSCFTSSSSEIEGCQLQHPYFSASVLGLLCSSTSTLRFFFEALGPWPLLSFSNLFRVCLEKQVLPSTITSPQRASLKFGYFSTKFFVILFIAFSPW